jgi:hypothetical protein
VEKKLSAQVHTSLEAQPAFHTRDTGSVPEEKLQELYLNYPTPSNTEVKERVEL